ncbi:MAG TPA: nucleotidyltransferase domain-containing protein [Candidatus Limnocylindria bacterium]|nr:nucleotidyltransferase domain-containing protein [Candidatus Limnocylindria bacterium]
MTEAPALRRDPVLDEIVRRLVDAFHPEGIYLFGSMARGDAGPDSDYDLMVLVREAHEPEYRLSQRAHSLRWDLRSAPPSLAWTVERFERQQHLRASLPATILREASGSMRDDSERVGAVRSWLNRAADDLRAGEHVLTAEPPLVGDARFHVEQAAERR